MIKMEEKIVSFYEAKKKYGQPVVLTDELLDTLGEKYQQTETNLSFYQWVELKLINLM